MRWYQVAETINGRKYLYWQRTYRVGKHVKTLNTYIGPAGLVSATPRTTPASACSPFAPMVPEDAKDCFTPVPPEARTATDLDIDKILERRQCIVAQFSSGHISRATFERRMRANNEQYDKHARGDDLAVPQPLLKIETFLTATGSLIRQTRKRLRKGLKRT